MLRNTLNSFGSITKWLHWVVFILLVIQFYLIFQFKLLPQDFQDKGLFILLHKSLGATLLILGGIFLVWRMNNQRPIELSVQPQWQRLAAKIVHNALLTMLILMPILGYLLSCAAGKPVNFFGLFYLPMLISQNQTLAAALDWAHVNLGFVMLLVIGLHILAALYHHFILKDQILVRMLPE